MTNPVYHLTREDYLFASTGEPRGFIQPRGLEELWIHTGTACNLACPFCLEGSRPGDKRIQEISFSEAKSFIDEALTLGVKRFSFTGGEPFVNRDMVAILDYALNFRSCLVLTNGTAPLKKRLPEVIPLLHKKNPLNVRISLDYPDPEKHDASRGPGNFQRALDLLGELHRLGFPVAVARQQIDDEDTEAVNRAYHPFLLSVGVPVTIPFVVFPDFLPPGTKKKVPEITENCMTTYQDEAGRAKFMCAYSRMIVKMKGEARVYACTLVDDDQDYDLGRSLTSSLTYAVKLKHHRCYSCFAFGSSCSQN